jgi:hypothetical protein
MTTADIIDRIERTIDGVYDAATYNSTTQARLRLVREDLALLRASLNRRRAGMADAPPDLRQGDEVFASVGTKYGWGRVVSDLPAGCTVQFPDRRYPETMAHPTGLYMVPWAHIYEVRRAWRTDG